MTEFYRQYLAVAVFVVAAFAMVGAMLGAARLLRPTNPQDEKYITYESGSDPLPLFGQAFFVKLPGRRKIALIVSHGSEIVK